MKEWISNEILAAVTTLELEQLPGRVNAKPPADLVADAG
jgi:hypothetical protein